MNQDLCALSATDLLQQYRAKKLSPVEALRAVLARVEALNPVLNCFNLVDEKVALAAARASESRWQKGEPMGPLDGVPTSIKDIILTKGWPTRRGSKTVDPKGPWNDDAPAVARLREAGAVLFGKTTTPEFGWKGVTDSPLTGITRNPWNPKKTPGGSSGGSAAAVASGMGPLTVGTDGGGSIRIPCAFTGLFGLKPSFGRVPAWPLSPFGTVAHLGPITRTVTDAALMMNVLALPDARDWHALPWDKRNYLHGLEEGVTGLRIAYSPDLGYAKVDREIAALVKRAAKAFEDLGAKVEEADPGFEDQQQVFTLHWFPGAAYVVRGIPAAKRKLMDKGLLEVARAGERITMQQYQDGVARRGALGTLMNRFHEKYDLLLTPTVATAAFELGILYPDVIDGKPVSREASSAFTFPFNMTGEPAASVPCGFTREGLPIGLQVVGRRFADATVLRACAALEKARPWADRRPSLS